MNDLSVPFFKIKEKEQFMSTQETVVIYTPWITRGGKRIYASQYGLKVFRLEIPKNKYRPRKSA